MFVSTDLGLFCLLCSDSCFCSRFRSCTFMGGRRLPWQIISTKLARSAPSGNQENKICKQWVVLTWGWSYNSPPLSLPNLIPMLPFPSIQTSPPPPTSFIFCTSPYLCPSFLSEMPARGSSRRCKSYSPPPPLKHLTRV